MIMHIRKALTCCGLLFALQAGAQLTAGQISNGQTLTTYDIHLEPTEDFVDAVAFIDVNCDSQDDLKIRLQRNAPYMDIPNRLYVVPLTSSFRICAADTAALCSFNHAYLYSQGQSMSCSLPFSLLVDTSYVIGDYVTYTCGGTAPQSADSIYIHYANDVNGVDTEGWVMLSFNLLSSAPVGIFDPWADIHSAVGVCDETGIGKDPLDDARIKFHPNPTTDGLVHWSSPTLVVSLEVYDCTGRLVHASGRGTNGQFDLSGRQGAFHVLCRTMNGGQLSERLVVY